MRYLLALDQGTTSTRALVFDHRGRVRAQAQQEFTQHYPRPGWVEHDPVDIWETTRRVAIAAVADANLSARDIVGIGLTNQRETTLLWDRATGKPLARAIVWQDRRTADRCAQLKAGGHEAVFRRKTGLLLDPYFSGTKLAWLLDHVRGARRRAERGELAFGTVDTWLLWNLTGGRIHATDATNASRTLLYNLRTGDWDDELLDLLRKTVVRPKVTETTALGAAYFAGLACGYWKNRDEIAGLWESSRVFRPKAAAAARRLHAGWRRAVERAKGWAE
jgi:glycerol kinase